MKIRAGFSFSTMTAATKRRANQRGKAVDKTWALAFPSYARGSSSSHEVYVVAVRYLVYRLIYCTYLTALQLRDV